MRAMQLTALEGPSALQLVDVPEPGGDDVVTVRVGAIGVNFPDLLIMRGQYQLRVEPPFIPGSEVAGTVISAPESSGWRAGDRVVAVNFVGGYAETVAVEPQSLARTPEVLDDVQAVAMAGNHQTAYFALVERARVAPGETVLVLGAAGGVGSASVQVARALGAGVIGVVHREGADEFVRSLGAQDVVRLGDGWADRVREVVPGGVDLVIDPIGGPAFDDVVRVLAPGGRLVVVGFASGGGIPSVKVNRLLLRNIDVLGAGWGGVAEPRSRCAGARRGRPRRAGARRPASAGDGALSPGTAARRTGAAGVGRRGRQGRRGALKDTVRGTDGAVSRLPIPKRRS